MNPIFSAEPVRFRSMFALLVAAGILLPTNLASGQSWLSNLVDKAAKAGEKLDQQQNPDAKKPAAEPKAAAAEPQPVAAEPQPEPAKAAVTEAPAQSSAEPSGQNVLITAAPESAVEPESNWGILRELLSTDLPPVGSSGPILASLTGEAAVVASAVPVALQPEATPATEQKATASRSTPRPRATSKPRSSQPRQRQQAQPRQSQPEPRRSLYNPYSTYSR